MDTFDIDECAEFLKVNRTTALELAANGDLPGAKIGRAWVFLRDDMVEYLRLTVRNQQRDRQNAATSSKSAVSDYIPATIALQSSGKASRRKAIPALPELCGQV